MNITFGEATESDLYRSSKWEQVVRDFLELREPDGSLVKFRVILADDIPSKTVANGLMGAIRRSVTADPDNPYPVRVVQRKDKIYLARTDLDK